MAVGVLTLSIGLGGEEDDPTAAGTYEMRTWNERRQSEMHLRSAIASPIPRHTRLRAMKSVQSFMQRSFAPPVASPKGRKKSEGE
jgi:hypothetical protein